MPSMRRRRRSSDGDSAPDQSGCPEARSVDRCRFSAGKGSSISMLSKLAHAGLQQLLEARAIALIAAVDRGEHGFGSRHHRHHAIDIGGDLELLQRLEVVGIRRRDDQLAVHPIEHQWIHTEVTRHALRHDLDGTRVDLGFAHALGRHELRLVHSGDELEKLALANDVELDHSLLDTYVFAFGVVDRAHVRRFVDQPILKQPIGDAFIDADACFRHQRIL